MIGVANDRQGRTKQDCEQPEENEGEIRRARQLLQKGATREEEHQASRGAEDEYPLISNERRNRSDRHFAKLIGSVPRAPAYHNPSAALAVREAMLRSLQSLTLFPVIGRPQSVEGVRKLVTPNTA